MDWNIRMNRALDYIESHLGDDIDFDYAAKLAFCTRNDLSNMFLMVTGIQLSEYVRRRRLSLAALDLQNSDEKIIDIAMKYGYSSPTAFNRAFQNQHKVSPQYARSRRIFLNTYPRITFQIKLNGDAKMKVRIEKKPAFHVVGVMKTFRNDSVENLVPHFWRDLPQETYDTIIKEAGGEPKGMLGVCADFDGSMSSTTTSPYQRRIPMFRVWIISKSRKQLGLFLKQTAISWICSTEFGKNGSHPPVTDERMNPSPMSKSTSTMTSRKRTTATSCGIPL